MRDLPIPEPGKCEVRIRVQAAAVHLDDRHMAEGTMLGGVPVAPKPTVEEVVFEIAAPEGA